MKSAKISITTGIIAGILFCAIWFMMAKSLGFYEVKVYMYRNIVVFPMIILGVFISVFLTRRSNEGFLEFKQALQAGMLFALVFATVVAVFNYCYYHFITPDTIDYFVSEAKKDIMADPRYKADELPKQLEGVRANYDSFRLVPPVLFWGLIISLLSGLLLQKKSPHTFHEN